MNVHSLRVAAQRYGSVVSAGTVSSAARTPQTKRYLFPPPLLSYPTGLMFALRRKKLSGLYLVFTATSRS